MCILCIYNIYSLMEEMALRIVLSNASQRPMYEQIAQQIRAQIAAGELRPGEALLSIRQLARDLRVSIITTKRAYEDLEQEGFIRTVPGKGTFVAQANGADLHTLSLQRAVQDLAPIVRHARQAGVTREEMLSAVREIYEEEME